MNEKIKILTEFLELSHNVFNCMKNKCKIIDEKINKNPLYKEYTLKLLSAKNDEELIKSVDDVMSVAEHPEYTKCQYKNCNINIKKFVIFLLKLYDFYKTKEKKIFPDFIEQSLANLKLANSTKKPLIYKYDRDINILLIYISRLG